MSELSKEEYEQIQYTRASTLSIDLTSNDDETSPYIITDRDGKTWPMRDIYDVSEWLDRYEDSQKTF